MQDLLNRVLILMNCSSLSWFIKDKCSELLSFFIPGFRSNKEFWRKSWSQLLRQFRRWLPALLLAYVQMKLCGKKRGPSENQLWQTELQVRKMKSKHFKSKHHLAKRIPRRSITVNESRCRTKRRKRKPKLGLVFFLSKKLDIHILVRS